MVKHSKILEKLVSGSQNIRFDEFMTLLEEFGFVRERVRGSHHIFKHPSVSDLLSIQPRKDGKAKPYQLRQLLKLVEEYNLHLPEDRS